MMSPVAKARNFYPAVFLVTCATLMLELIETRLLSVIAWYYLAFFVISTAMFGMTAGAVWVYRRSAVFTPLQLNQNLCSYSLGFAVSTALALVLQFCLVLPVRLSLTAFFSFGFLCLALAAPFFFSGVVVSLALTRSPYPVGRVYAADLAGAAVGCLGVLLLLNLTDAPSAVLWVATLGAVAVWLFSRAQGAWRLPFSPVLPAALLAALALANGLVSNGIHPLFIKGSSDVAMQAPLFEKWNHLAFVRVSAPKREQPFLYGPSPKMDPDTVVEQILVDIDGWAGTAMVRFDGNADAARFLNYDVVNLAYSLRNNGRAAIVGVGGGRDVLSAYVAGFRDITAIEVNPIFLDLLQRRQPFKDFAHLSALPGVSFVLDDGRSWFARSGDSFDLVQMSMTDTWAATSAGAFTLSENGLYTVEAWKTFLSHLAPHGVFTVSRWYAPGAVNETGRMVSLAVATLLELGERAPSRHVFLASRGNVATLVVGRSALAPADVAALTAACNFYRYDVEIRPDEPASTPLLRQIVAAADRAELDRVTSTPDLDLTPPTDERPFFFNILPLKLGKVPIWLSVTRATAGAEKGNLTATLVLFMILIVSVVVVAVTVLLPLRSSLATVPGGLIGAGTLYFGALGAGFMLVEIGLIQKLNLFLGHPTYSLSVVLFALILSTGLGSLICERIVGVSVHKLALWALILSAYLCSMSLWYPLIVSHFQAAAIAARVSLAIAIIVPPGLLMGFAFPAGMRMVQALDSRPMPWFWGINGAAGVFASSLAVILSMACGIVYTIVLGGLCYASLIPICLSPVFRTAQKTSATGEV